MTENRSDAFVMPPFDDERKCSRFDKGDVHEPHEWRWHGKWITALYRCPGLAEPHVEPAVGVAYVVQSLTGDNVWEDHYAFPGDWIVQRHRACEMAEGMDEDHRGPWRVARRVTTDEEVVTFRSSGDPTTSGRPEPRRQASARADSAAGDDRG